jgi:hypothetical protein
MSYNANVYREQGGNRLVVRQGGEIEVRAGGRVDLQEGALLNLENGYSADGLGMIRLAKATWDFAEHGGAIGAHGLGVTLPDNAIVVGGFVDVITTCATAGADAGTMAIHVQGANDIVAAVAVNDAGKPWDAGLHAIVPKANTPESTGIKLTAPREITATIAGQAFTAGKFVVFLYYVLSD